MHSEELQNKIVELSKQVIESRSRVLQLEREGEQVELLAERLKER